MNEAPTSLEIARGERILILPLGSWEQHGPHLPLDTDSVIISHVIDESLAHPSIGSHQFLCAPLLPITASDEHAGFAGGLSTGTEALVSAVVAICRSASEWSAGTIIANGHGGNFDALQHISSALTFEEILHSVWSLPSYVNGDMHAGHTETSLMMHIAPQLVRTEHIAELEPTQATVNDLRTKGVHGVSTSGVIGNPRTATPDHGKLVLNLYVNSLVREMQTRVAEWLHF